MRGATRAARVAHGARRAALRSPPCPCRKRDASQLRPNAAQTSSRPAIMSASKQRRPARRNSGLAVVAAAELASARKILAKWFSPTNLSSETFKGSGKARETAPLKPKAWLQQDNTRLTSSPCSARSKLKDRVAASLPSKRNRRGAKVSQAARRHNLCSASAAFNTQQRSRTQSWEAAARTRTKCGRR